MSIVEPGSDYAELRDDLRRLRPPFLLRTYEATAEDYEQITDEDLKCEFVDGELIVHSPASLEHEDLAAFTIALLRESVSARRLGTVYGSNAVMQLGERRFSPDVSVLKNENSGRIHPKRKRVMGPMDLVVELLSTSTRQYDLHTKLPAYREGRVGEIWLIDRERRQFEAHGLTADHYLTWSGAAGRWASLALPGLVIDVDWFWRSPLPSLAECRTSLPTAS